MKYFIRLLLCVGSATAFALVFGPFVQAQSSGRTARPDALQLEIRRISEREMLERILTEPPKTTTRPSLGLAEFKTDFISLQLVNNKLVKAVSTQDAIDLSFVAKSAGEIRKIARRLRTNLVLPKSGEAVQPASAEVGLELEQLRPTLSSLDGLILEFVSNPVFESSKVLDTQLSVKARRDLDRIIELSSALKKSSETLRQAATKTH